MHLNTQSQNELVSLKCAEKIDHTVPYICCSAQLNCTMNYWLWTNH